MKLLFSLLLCLVSGSCALVTVPVKTAGAIVTTTVKTTGTIVSAPFDDDDDDDEYEEDEDARERRRRQRHWEEVHRAEVYDADAPPHPYYDPAR